VLEIGVGLLAGLLLLIGILIMAGPLVTRGLRLALRRRRPFRLGGARAARTQGELHPTTRKALAAAGRIATILKEQGMDRYVAALRHASRRLEVNEADGIYAMQEVLRHFRGIRLNDRDDQEILEGLVGQLRKALNDRAEQLEILPRS
jgi:hypothetical protein